MATLPIAKTDKYVDLVKYIQNIDNDDKFVIIDNINYYNINNASFKKENNYDFYDADIIFEEYFSEEDWDIINFQNRSVIDVGANVADRTLYFAKHGAKVIGFEPTAIKF